MAESKYYRLSKECTSCIKGFAIILVIISHMIQRGIVDIPYLLWGGQMGVTLFLILSGYGLTRSFKENGLTGFFSKRVTGVLFPYLLITLLWVIIDKLFLGQDYSFLVINLALVGLDYSRTIDPSMWYITYILLWYIAFFVVFSLKIRNEIRILVLLYISYLIFFHFPQYVFLKQLGYQFRLYAFMFSIGVLLGLCFDSIMMKLKRYQLYVLLTVMIASLGAFILFLAPNNTAVNLMIFHAKNILWGIGVIIAFVVLCNKFNLKPLKMIGEYSFELYLLEFVFLFKYDIFKLVSNKPIGIILYLLLLAGLSVTLKKLTHMIRAWNDMRFPTASQQKG